MSHLCLEPAVVGEEPTALSRKPSLGDVDPDAWKAIPTLVSHGSHKRPGLSAAQIAQPGSIPGAPRPFHRHHQVEAQEKALDLTPASFGSSVGLIPVDYGGSWMVEVLEATRTDAGLGNTYVTLEIEASASCMQGKQSRTLSKAPLPRALQ